MATNDNVHALPLQGIRVLDFSRVLGSHTEAVLGELLGMSAEQVAKLKADKVV
ncbi:MAG TPA: hypothetical protein VKS80_08945 [Trinickia sp.]|nr:hypothetical protein [Trinickia sp.]